MNRFFFLFTLLLTAYLSLLHGAEEGSLQEVVDKLELYNQDATGKDFIKVLSWSYNEKLEEYLNDFIEELEPTVIAIQNITNDKIALLSERNIMRHYEVIGIQESEEVDGKAIVNPIFYKGDRIQPPKTGDKRNLKGVIKNNKNGQINWARFRIVDLSRAQPNRKKRDLKPDNSFMAKIFQAINDPDVDDCSIPGTMVIANANLNSVNDQSEEEFLKPIYKKVLCRSRSKIFFTGNVGWKKSHSAMFKFGKRMLSVKTFNINNKRNLNQIWANDFKTVRDITSNIITYNGNNVTMTIKGHTDMVTAPTFAAFHYESIQTFL